MEIRFICNTCKKQIVNQIHPNFPRAMEAVLDICIRATGYFAKHQNHDIEVKASKEISGCWDVIEEDL